MLIDVTIDLPEQRPEKDTALFDLLLTAHDLECTASKSGANHVYVAWLDAPLADLLNSIAKELREIVDQNVPPIGGGK